MSSSRHNISHSTEIDAPAEEVWKCLLDFDDWKSWNKWTVLQPTKKESTRVSPVEQTGTDPVVLPGTKGKLHACFEGDDKNWKTYDFEFGTIIVNGIPVMKMAGEGRPIDSNQDTKAPSEEEGCYLLTWKGQVGPGGFLFSGHHTMRLEDVPVDGKKGQGKRKSKTKLIHEETFGGLLPMLGCGLPFAILNRNYRLMNEALKEHVEKKQQENGFN